MTWDPTHQVSDTSAELLLEAARWSPSAGNSQPWSFVVALRGDPMHARLVPHLAPSARRWAPDASLIVVNICHRYVEGTDWDYSEFAEYDLGQAVANMIFQAQSMDLYARQFRAFDRQGVEKELQIPGHWVAMTMTVIGRPAAGSPAPVARPRRERQDLVWSPVD